MKKYLKVNKLNKKIKNKKDFSFKKIQHVWDSLGISFAQPFKDNDGDLALNNRHTFNYHISMLNNCTFDEK